jgi:3-deoxy-D-manno-octulosonic-acid transferase
LNLLYGAYGALTGGLFLSLYPGFWIYTRITGRYRQHLEERLGYLPARIVQSLTGRPRIWIHAASLGEVKVAASVVDALRTMLPDCSIVISTITEHGRKLAKETFGEKIPVIYAPIDFVGSVRKTLSTVRPDIMVFLETEIWPGWLFEARRMGIRTALINGRISLKSVGGYRKFQSFFREVLKNFDAFSMIRQEDAARILAMGAASKKIEINGNAKYDLLENTVSPNTEAEMRKTLNLDTSQRVFIAGSTRNGEEAMVLDAYDKILNEFPETILIIAPRHLQRTPAVVSLVEAHGLRYQLRTDLDKGKAKRTAQVVIINTFGELSKVYSIGTIVLCGASLVPLGGQNPLEPAIWGKTVFYGPSMENFLDAKIMLETEKAGVLVNDSQEMAEKAIWFLGHPEELKNYGKRARMAVLKNKGAGRKHAQVIMRLWGDRRITAENEKEVGV